MDTVEVIVTDGVVTEGNGIEGDPNEWGPSVCGFARVAYFVFGEQSESQSDLAEKYAEQATAMGWPMNWIGYGRPNGEVPILIFNQKQDGEIIYNVTGWVQAYDRVDAVADESETEA